MSFVAMKNSLTNRSFVSYAGNDHVAALNAIKAKFPTAIFNGPQFDGRQLITVVATASTRAELRKTVRGFAGHVV